MREKHKVKGKKPKLPRVPVPKPTRVHGVKKPEPKENWDLPWDGSDFSFVQGKKIK